MAVLHSLFMCLPLGWLDQGCRHMVNSGFKPEACEASEDKMAYLGPIGSWWPWMGRPQEEQYSMVPCNYRWKMQRIKANNAIMGMFDCMGQWQSRLPAIGGWPGSLLRPGSPATGCTDDTKCCASMVWPGEGLNATVQAWKCCLQREQQSEVQWPW